MVEIDGRVARRRRNREAVIEAAVALMQEGVLDPTVEQITVRSGVSPRSVFRYFESLDEMRRAVLLATMERVDPLLVAADAAGTLEERAERIVADRLEMFEQAEGAARAARLREPQVPLIAEDLSRVRERQRAQVQASFGPELTEAEDDEAERLAALVEVILAFESWDLLRRVQGRDREFVRRAWVRALTGLLRPPASGNGSGGRLSHSVGSG